LVLSQYSQIDRSASAMDYRSHRHSPSPAPRVASADAATTTFAMSQSYAQDSAFADENMDLMTPRPNADEDDPDKTVQEVGWWTSTTSSQTPTAATFVQVGDGTLGSTSSDGFVSLMDDHQFAVSHSTSSHTSRQQSLQEEEEEDLGFGNSKPKPKNLAEGTVPDKPGAAGAASSEVPSRPGMCSFLPASANVDEVMYH
jgi:COPII coat assembly protein SEC16